MNLTHSRWGRLATLAVLVIAAALTLVGSIDPSYVGTAT